VTHGASERTFAKNLLHVAAVDFDVAGRVSGSQVGPDFGKDEHNPSRDVYRTKDDVLKLLEQAVAAGATVIQQQGDAGLGRTMLSCAVIPICSAGFRGSANKIHPSPREVASSMRSRSASDHVL
jgi:hypothetical protein